VTRALAVVAAALVAAVLLACPPRNLPQAVPPAPMAGSGYEPPAPVDHPDVTPTAVGAAAGAACTSGGDCQSGVCEGEGCGAGAGVCAAAQRACTFDIQAYCGCDGATFDASGSCPERRYAHRGACTPATGGGSAATALPTGAACLVGTECASGVCEGKGCGADLPGVCVAQARRCTRDRRTFCGCDGQTFYGSGSCPGRRYAAAGTCPTP